MYISKEQRAKRKDDMSEGQTGKRIRRPHWRFEDLQIWNSACDLAVDSTALPGGLTRGDSIGMQSNCVPQGCHYRTTSLKGLEVPTNKNSFNFSTLGL